MPPIHLLPQDPGLDERLRLLGFRDADAAAFKAGLDRLDVADRRAVDRDVELLTAAVGAVSPRRSPVGEAAEPHPVGTDFPLLVALVAVAPLTQAELVRRGLPDDLAWRSVSDLGQQVHIHRKVHGAFGFGARGWSAANLGGSHVWLGRLQYTLEDDPVHGRVLGVHIPETGPLAPALVDESLALAARLGPALYPERPIAGFVCTSWLLDADLLARLAPDSNLARFGARFTPFGAPYPGTGDALYFGFHRGDRSGGDVDPDALPQDTSLQRAIVAQLRTRVGVRVASGWLPFP